MRLDVGSDLRQKRASRTEPGEMFRTPADEEEPALGGVARGKSGSTMSI